MNQVPDSTKVFAGCASAFLLLATYVPFYLLQKSCTTRATTETSRPVKVLERHTFGPPPLADADVAPAPTDSRPAANPPAAAALVERSAPPAPSSRDPRIRKLAIILCKFRDQPLETHPPSWYADYYVRSGTGGQADYWRDVTFGAIDLTQSEVFGWYTMQHDTSEVRRLVFPGGRSTLVQWGKDAAQNAGVDLSQYDGVVVIQSWGIDHGAAGNGVVFVDANAAAFEPTFISHEMGHLFGLGHSFGEPGVAPCITGHGEYCDAWDVMSAMNVFSYTGTFESWSVRSGPGLNAFAARSLGALPPQRIRRIDRAVSGERVALAALNQPLREGEIYVVDIPPYTIEYRHKAGWDAGLPSDAVLVHAEKGGRSYLELTPGNAGLHAGDHYVTASPRVDIDVESIDPVLQRAVVRITRR